MAKVKRKTNPLPIPKGKWVKVTKAKVNKNGTVSLMVPGSSLKKNPGGYASEAEVKRLMKQLEKTRKDKHTLEDRLNEIDDMGPKFHRLRDQLYKKEMLEQKLLQRINR